MPKRLLLKTYTWNQKTENEKCSTVTLKTASLTGRENAKWEWREIQQDLKSLASSSYFKHFKKYIWNFILLNCWWEVSFVNAVLGLLLSEGLAQSLFTEIKYTHSFLWMMGTPGQLLSTAIGQSISSNDCGAMPDHMRWRPGLEFPANWRLCWNPFWFVPFVVLWFFRCLATCLGNLSGHLGDTASATAQFLNAVGRSQHMQGEEWEGNGSVCVTIQVHHAHAAKSMDCI